MESPRNGALIDVVHAANNSVLEICEHVGTFRHAQMRSDEFFRDIDCIIELTDSTYPRMPHPVPQLELHSLKTVVFPERVSSFDLCAMVDIATRLVAELTSGRRILLSSPDNGVALFMASLAMGLAHSEFVEWCAAVNVDDYLPKTMVELLEKRSKCTCSAGVERLRTELLRTTRAGRG